MGNCNSSTAQRRATADTFAGDLLWKERSTTDYMDLHNDLDDATLPMSSPGSSLLPGNSPTAAWTPSPLTASSSARDGTAVPIQQTNVLSPLAAPVYTPKRASPTSQQPFRQSTPARHGKALQHRLEKARSIQSALSRSMTNYESDDNASMSSSNTPTHPSQRLHSSSSNSTAAAKTLNDEFEATMSQGMVWAEATLGDAVVCIAMSRRLATIDHPCPALYMAVGTKSGVVTIFELIEDSPVSTPSTIREEVDDNNDETNDDASIHLDDLQQQNQPQPQLSRQHRLRTAATIHHAGGRVRSLDFSPDGSFLAMGGDDCSCTLYALLYASNGTNNDDLLIDAELYGEIQRVDRVYCVQFSPDGAFLAIGCFDGVVAIVLRDDFLNSHMPDVTVEIPRDGLIFTLDWSPDSRYLAIGGSDKCCAVVDTQTSWSVMREIRRAGTVTDVKWCPITGAHLAIASTNVAIVDRVTFSVRHEYDDGENEIKSEGPVSKVNAICWSPNGTYIVACRAESRCTLSETRNFTKVYDINRTKPIRSIVWGQRISASGTPRRYLAIGGDDERVVIVKAGLELNAGASATGDDQSLSSSSLISQRSDWTSKEKTFHNVDEIPQQKLSDRVDDGQTSDLNVSALAFSRGSKSRPSTFIAYCLDNGLVVTRSTIDFRVIAELRFSKSMACLAFSNGSRYLAMGGADGRVFVLETVPTWTVVAQCDFDSQIQTLAFSKHNERLLVGLQNGLLVLLDPMESYNVCGEIDVSTSCVASVDWTSKSFAVGRLDETVAVYESEYMLENTATPPRVLQQASPVCSISFGASGRFLAVASIDGTVHIYSAKGGWTICHQISVPPGLRSLAWSATGRLFAIAGEGYLRVFETIFWTEIQEGAHALLSGDLSRTISSLAFSQDESMLAVAVSGNGIRIVDCKQWKLAFLMNKADNDESNSSLIDEERDDAAPF